MPAAEPPTVSTVQTTWRVNTAQVTDWRMWDGEVVIYDDLSGDTLKLDAVTSVIFKRLQKGAATRDELVEHLSGVLDLQKTDLRLVRLAEIALDRLDRCAVVIPTGPAPGWRGPTA